ncbi:MAG TPA: GDSL-type esterase/lipase family protein [Nitrososphaerales archaeon]|nr:GDSL-type esterase/lipase family protein [Nitrososphaerales archaeon]
MNLSLKIVGLGDSTTAGTPGFESPLEAPPDGRGDVESQYAYWMMKLHPEWLVLNRGINGQRSDEILERLERDVLREGCDYAIILAGVNDLYQGRTLDSIEENLVAMHKRSIRAGIRTVAATVLPYNTMSQADYKSLAALNDWIRRVSHIMGTLFCDTSAAVSDPDDPTKLASSPDGLHPDPSGYRKMGESLARVIEESQVSDFTE